MSPSGPSIPSQGRARPQARAQTEPSTPVKKDGGKGAQTSVDQFSQTQVNLLVKQMKQVVMQQGKVFQPGHMMPARGPAKGLSDFEKVFLEYFLGKHSLGALLQAGEKKYRKKQLKEWKEFFERLYAYVKEKKADPDQIRHLIFRGISQEDPRPTQNQKVPVLVADIYLKRKRRDRCEQFVRLEISNQVTLEKLQQLKPGEQISVETLVENFGDGEVPYLCLYYRPVRQGLLGGLDQQASAAGRAREALFSDRLDVSSKAANLAKHQLKGEKKLKERKEPDSESDLYKQKNRLDKLLS